MRKVVTMVALAIAVTGCGGDEPERRPTEGTDAAAKDAPSDDPSPGDSGAPEDAGPPAVNGCTPPLFQDFTGDVAERVVKGPETADATQYVPNCMTIEAGQLVRFESRALGYLDYFEDHPLEPSGGDANNPVTATSTGSSATFTFPKAGTFGFRCRKHPDRMLGAIRVLP